ncbi:MAG: NAD(P)H-hydrate dehydratase [Chloroflexota bacterium]|nr:NAD(P)H-hydrate dehydratase [Chloroflexota bacterium]
MRILSITEMQELEQAAAATGHPYQRMMDLAGQGVARAILERQQVKGRRVLVLVGPGNNGGDGLVAARYLAEAGAQVTAYLSHTRDPESDPVFKAAIEHGVTIHTHAEETEGGELRRLLSRSQLLIDALLGTGAKPPLREGIAAILRVTQAVLARRRQHPLTILNRPQPQKRQTPFIVAVDGPSGLDFDTGEADPLTLPAQLTVTFAYPKRGHFRFPGAELIGELVVAKIGIPTGVTPSPDGPALATPQLIRAWLPPRGSNAHKGTFGKALLVAGSVNYTGAAALAAQAAVRSGAGLVTLGIAGSLQASLVPLVPEATYALLPEALGVITADALDTLEEPLEEYDALLVGPGLGQAPETGKFIAGLWGLGSEKRRTGFLSAEKITRESPRRQLPPLILDADGLNILSAQPHWPELLPPQSILTPHPGEMARLTGLSVTEIQAARWQVAGEYAQKWGQVVVLKGAFTVIAAPDGRARLLPFANAGLASAGTGDVLAGVIVALRAQGLEAFEAAVTGAYLHALAGELARQEYGEAGMRASDVIHALPAAFLSLQKE